ncbi:MAG: bifunctional phosphoglucose/phosphomannose isomerase [Fidelibacterota bacterium]
MPENLRELDPSDMYGHIHRFPEQLEQAMEIGRNIRLDRDYSGVKTVVLAGMGGSAIGGDTVIALTSPFIEVPMVVRRHTSLPNWVGESTLVFVLSYSGNTQETVSCLKDAVRRNAMVAGITSGGMIKDELDGLGAPVVTIPSGYPPRACLGYLSVPVVYFLRETGLISESMEGQMTRAVAHLRKWRDVFGKPDEANPAYGIARQIYDSLPVIYGVEDGSAAVARRWRSQLEENGKMVAFHHLLPEMSHNEIVGYENNPELMKRLSVMWLIGAGESGSLRTRQRLTRSIIGDAVKIQLDIESRGDTRIEKLFYLIHLGDWVSFWAAMFHGTDPTPVHKIDRLKVLLRR